MNREERFKVRLIHVVNLSAIITINIFFNIFAWDKYDLSPNMALAFFSFIVTLTSAILLKKIPLEEESK